MAKKTADAAPAANRRQATAPRRAAESKSIPTAKDTAAALTAGPSADEIAQEAYLRYLGRGGSHGSHFDDWIEAERDLKKRRNGASE